MYVPLLFWLASRCPATHAALANNHSTEVLPIMHRRMLQHCVGVSGMTQVYVDEGEVYQASTPSTPLATVCDRGAVAKDPADGDLTANVFACSPSGKHKFASSGVKACNIDPNVPGVHLITFTVSRILNGLDRPEITPNGIFILLWIPDSVAVARWAVRAGITSVIHPLQIA